MGDESNLSTAAPPAELPKMVVGVNQPFKFNWELYGQNFGPPLGGNTFDRAGFWRNIAPTGLEKLKELGVKIVRLFILGNAYNYGPDPQPVTRKKFELSGDIMVELDVKQCSFDPPDDEKTLNPFFNHFELMLDAFRRVGGIQVMPCVIDFQAFIERPGSREFGRRADLIRYPKKRDIFVETMLNGLLAVAGGYREQIYAWDAFNEPIHLVTPISKYVYGDSGLHTEFLPLPAVQDFIRAILKKIEDRKYQTTVGHRLLSDLSSYRLYSFGSTCVGTIRHFHYYHVIGPLGIGGDDDRLPDFSTSKAILGEFGSYPKTDELWKEDLNGKDADVKDAAFERLKVAAAKGYSLAMPWPDGGTDDPILGFSQDARDSIKRFTHTRFPNGVPPL